MMKTLKERAADLGLHGFVASWDEVREIPQLERLLELEEDERQARGLARRRRNARLGRFKSMADFDYAWPKRLDRKQLDELFSLRFVDETTNVILVGPNGVGKTMIAKNLVERAVRSGHTAKFLTASELLHDLGAQDSTSALRRRIKHYARPRILVIDEVGYLSYDSQAADLLFEVVNVRYQSKPTILTTNRPFAEWNEVFPSATCVVTLVDRLVHNAEIVQVDGESYRLKEARESAAERRARREAD